MNAVQRTMPGEWEEHRATAIAWPTREEVWGETRPLAEREYATLVNAIADDEPALVICRQSDAATVRTLCPSPAVTIIVHPIDDGWLRDNGPIITRAQSPTDATSLEAVAFGFNSWGHRFAPTVGDLSVRRAIADALQIPYVDASSDLVLEGGAVSSNGAGTLLVSAECVLTTSRNPRMTRANFEELLAQRLGAHTIIWVPFGLLEDLPNTDGHVDNVAVFVGSHNVLVQTVTASNPNADRLAANMAALQQAVLPDGRPLRLIECDVLPYARLPDGREQVVPYVNFVLTNRSVILPSAGRADDDARAKRIFEQSFPDRRVRFTPSVVLAYGGGGPHCVTLNISRQ